MPSFRYYELRFRIPRSLSYLLRNKKGSDGLLKAGETSKGWRRKHTSPLVVISPQENSAGHFFNKSNDDGTYGANLIDRNPPYMPFSFANFFTPLRSHDGCSFVCSTGFSRRRRGRKAARKLQTESLGRKLLCPGGRPCRTTRRSLQPW